MEVNAHRITSPVHAFLAEFRQKSPLGDHLIRAKRDVLDS